MDTLHIQEVAFRPDVKPYILLDKKILDQEILVNKGEKFGALCKKRSIESVMEI